MTLVELHRQTRQRLAQAGIDTPDIDARLIVEHLTSTTRTDAIADPGRHVAADMVAAIDKALARRIAGEPVYRILGFREFYGLRFSLSAETLEPRPDTETLVDALLPHANAAIIRHGTCRILDLGTGAGAIALALLSQVDEAVATGVDISADALGTARRNADALGLSARFATLESSWFESVLGRYHVIASNPPYIPSHDITTLQDEVRHHDPIAALDGGEDGLDAYRAIAQGAKRHLEADGVVGVEIGHTQSEEVRELFEDAGFRLDAVRADIGGRDRVLIFR